MIGSTGSRCSGRLDLPLRKDPLPYRMRKAIAFDAEIAGQYPCSVCGARPCRYDYSYQARPYSYRAFAICPNGHVEEF